MTYNLLQPHKSGPHLARELCLVEVYAKIADLPLTSFKPSHMADIFLQPSSNDLPVLKTAAWFCIVFCICSLKSEVLVDPLELSNLSILAIDSSPAF